MSPTRKFFLTAEWRDLVMLNYEVDPRLLDKYVPAAQVSIRSLEKHTLASWAFGFAAPNSLGPSPSRFILISMR